MGDMAEAFREMRQHQKKVKNRNRNNFDNVLRNLPDKFKVVPVNYDFQYRVNGFIDLYPSSKKFHNIKTGKRGYFSFNLEKLIPFLEAQPKDGGTK